MTIWIPDIAAGDRPIYLAIVNTLADDIKNKRLEPGLRLPTHRDLADALGVTVGTVTRAYAEAHRRGLVKGEIGRGTYVADQSFEPIHLNVHTHVSDDVIDLSLNTPVYEHNPDLSATLKQIAGRPDLQGLLQYLPSAGLPRHRAAGAAWVKKCRLTAESDEVIVCGGSQHAIQVSLGAVVRPGDTVLTEPLIYPGVKSLANLLNLRLEPVAIDDEGLLPEACEAVLKKGGIKALYCTPTLHNPTTGTLSSKRRQDIAALARKYDLVIIEDDLNGPLLPEAPPPISSFARERSCYIAGTSKTLAGGLRISYLVGPPMLSQRLKLNVTATIWMATPLTAEIAATWIEDGTAERIVEKRREESAERHHIARRLLRGFSFRSHPAAYHLWLHLPDPWRSGIFAAEAFKQGVVVTPAEAFFVGTGEIPNAVRISLSAARNRQQLEKGLGIIVQMLSGPQDLTPGIF